MEKSDVEVRVVPLPLPVPDVDNPLPIVLAKHDAVVLSYMSFIVKKDMHVLVTFHTAFDHRFGPPGRENLKAHPLAARGLKPDSAYEVKGSSWARGSFGGKGKHYVFTFKDATFECVAEGFGSETTDENDDAVRLMARRLYK